MTTTDPAPFICAECGESAKYWARQMCQRCYSRAYYAGALEGHQRRPRLVQLSEALDAVEFLRPRITVDPVTGCWLWTMAKTKAGYPTMSVDGRTVYVHRWSYETIGGHDIPEGWHVDHISCPDPCCVNPTHLQALSPGDHSRLTHERVRLLKEAGDGYELVPPTRVRGLLELAATVRLDDGRAAPAGAGIIRP